MKRYPVPHEIELKLIAGLREKGYKMTPQRLEIINLLAHDRSHPGAIDILHKLKKTAPRVSMSTVYYTLDILKKEGLIQARGSLTRWAYRWAKYPNRHRAIQAPRGQGISGGTYQSNCFGDIFINIMIIMTRNRWFPQVSKKEVQTNDRLCWSY